MKQKKSKSYINKIINDYNINAENYPVVTIQLPVYNEKDVIERLIKSAINIDYPKDKLEIQILDDSTDETADMIKCIINTVKSDLKYKDLIIKLIRRDNRIDYKAGALQNGVNLALGDYLVIFDSDFIIPENFLKRTIPLIDKKDDIACVQTRWGFINQNENIITRSLSVGIGGHFAIEQGARFYNNLFLNFNGTAGIWRKEAVLRSGGWQGDTLTEDLDLSYRAQLKGYKIIYDFDTECKSEIPNNIIDFKSQQYRWAKGSIQTTMKLFPEIFKSKNISLTKKIEAFFHMTHYILSLLMTLHCFISLPFLMFIPVNSLVFALFPLWLLVILTSFAPLSLYMGSGFILKKPLFSFFHIPLLMIIGSGSCINNTKAIIEAIFGVKSGFVRTPKTGSTDKKNFKSSYKLNTDILIGLTEMIIGIYSLIIVFILINKDINFYIFFILINAIGFLSFGFYTIKRYLHFKFFQSEYK